MRYAIFSDIHGNLEALEAVLTQIEMEKVDQLICLGDIVGYGPNPNECIKRVREIANFILAGNHDYAVVGLTDISYFNYNAQNAIMWTGDVLTPESRNFLSSLPLMERVDGLTLVHATPEDPINWDYILSISEAIRNFSSFEDQMCFIGHSHVPLVLIEQQPGHCYIEETTQLILNEKQRYIINVGSVGQPRDLNPKAAYAILDIEKKLYQLKRTSYDIAKTQGKMRAANLPQFLIDRLETGQ